MLHFVEVDRRERSFSITLKDKRRYFGQLSECRALNASFARDMEQIMSYLTLEEA